MIGHLIQLYVIELLQLQGRFDWNGSHAENHS